MTATPHTETISPSIRVAVIEDDLAALERITVALQAAPDISIIASASNIARGMALIDDGGFDVLLCDLDLPDGSGIALVRHAAKKYASVNIVVMTASDSKDNVIESVRAGSHGFLLKNDCYNSIIIGIRDAYRGFSPINPLIARRLIDALMLQWHGFEKKRPTQFSKREVEVIELLARGFTFLEIGNILRIERSTVASYVRNIYHKLDVNSRTEAVFEAYSLGIISMIGSDNSRSRQNLVR